MKKEKAKAAAMKAKAKAAAPKAVTEKALQAKAAAPEPWPMTPAHIEAMKAGKAFCRCCQASVCDGFCEMHKLTCEFCEAQKMTT